MNPPVTQPRPLQMAHHLIQYFLEGQDTGLTVTDETRAFEALARLQARTVDALVVHHARRRRQAPNSYRVPRDLWPLVRRYERARGHLRRGHLRPPVPTPTTAG